jgi:hypothetical protein
VSAFQPDDRVLIGAGRHKGKVGTVEHALDPTACTYPYWVRPDDAATLAPYREDELTLHLESEGEQAVEDFAAEAVAACWDPRLPHPADIDEGPVRARWSQAGYASIDFGGAVA